MKRLELRLPNDHPLFKYPSGSRTAVAITLMDIGMKLSNIEDRLETIESKLENSAVIPTQEKVVQKGLTTEEKNKITQNILSVFG